MRMLCLLLGVAWAVPNTLLGLLADHERAHVFQYLALGPLFLPLYFACGGIGVRNRFERAADRYARTGRGWWPWSNESEMAMRG